VSTSCGFGIVLIVLVVVVVLIPSRNRPSSHRDTGDRPRAKTAGDEARTTTTDAARRVVTLLPTTASPLRVLEIGDSLGIDLGDQLEAQLDATGRVRTTVASVGDSGLANVTYLDWPTHLASLLVADRPQVVVVFIGANDDQGLYVDGSPTAPGTLAWVSGYTQRVDNVLQEVTSARARVVWVGMPPMANPDLNTAMQREDVIYQCETQRFPGTLYFSSAPVLESASGLYEATGNDGSGQQTALRTPDGVHLTPAGGTVLAHAVIDAIDHRWHLSLTGPDVPTPTSGG
jgi:hypothetical protein